MPHKVVVLLVCLSLGGCISTAIGVVAGATVAVAGAVITAPIKIGGAVIDAATDDDECEEHKENENEDCDD